MGYDLVSCNTPEESGGYARWNIRNWSHIVITAVAYGWQPSGTVNPAYVEPDDEWCGTYCSNDGQQVTSEDAQAMADALLTALKAAPTDVQEATEVPGDFVLYVGDDVVSLRWQIQESISEANSCIRDSEVSKRQVACALVFIAQNRERVAKFVEFLRLGSFRIY